MPYTINPSILLIGVLLLIFMQYDATTVTSNMGWQDSIQPLLMSTMDSLKNSRYDIPIDLLWKIYAVGTMPIAYLHIILLTGWPWIGRSLYLLLAILMPFIDQIIQKEWEEYWKDRMSIQRFRVIVNFVRIAGFYLGLGPILLIWMSIGLSKKVIMYKGTQREKALEMQVSTVTLLIVANMLWILFFPWLGRAVVGESFSTNNLDMSRYFWSLHHMVWLYAIFGSKNISIDIRGWSAAMKSFMSQKNEWMVVGITGLLTHFFGQYGWALNGIPIDELNRETETFSQGVVPVIRLFSLDLIGVLVAMVAVRR